MYRRRFSYQPSSLHVTTNGVRISHIVPIHCVDTSIDIESNEKFYLNRPAPWRGTGHPIKRTHSRGRLRGSIM